MVDYKIIRSTRKTIAIIVKPDGQVQVRAPHRVSKARIQQFVDQKRAWIEDKLARVPLAAAHAYAPGEQFYYLGKTYPLEVVKRNSPALTFTGDSFQLAQSALPRAAQVFTAWYKQQAKQYLPMRAAVLAAHFQLTVVSVRITSARTRWGSCSAAGSMNLTWRLIMTPPESIDYVIVHELAHLIHKNHSKQFWAEVADMMPDYAQRAGWLKEHGRRLASEFQ